MRRLSVCAVVVVCASQSVSADVRADQRVKFQLAGALGKIVNFFGGKGAREGITTGISAAGSWPRRSQVGASGSAASEALTSRS